MEILILEDLSSIRKELKRTLVKILGDQAIIQEAGNMPDANALLERSDRRVSIVLIDGNLSPIFKKRNEEGRNLETKTRTLYPKAVVVDFSMLGDALNNPDFICPKVLAESEKEAVLKDAINKVKV